MQKYYYYQIENTITNKCYIGITINPKERYRRHFSELRTKTHHSSKLQNAFNKYGEDAFVFTILEEKDFETANEAYDYEIVLIARYDSYYNGYNCALGGNHSPMENPDIAYKSTQANKDRAKNVVQISMTDLSVVNTFQSIREAARETGYSKGNIGLCCNRQTISTGGFYWAFEEEYTKNWKPKVPDKSKPIAEIRNGEVVAVFESAKKAAEYYGIDRSNIRASILRNGTCNGRKFKYISLEEYYSFS